MKLKYNKIYIFIRKTSTKRKFEKFALKVEALKLLTGNKQKLKIN